MSIPPIPYEVEPVHLVVVILLLVADALVFIILLNQSKKDNEKSNPNPRAPLPPDHSQPRKSRDYRGIPEHFFYRESHFDQREKSQPDS